MRVSRRHSATKNEKLRSGNRRYGRAGRWANIFANRIDAQNHLARRSGNSPARIFGVLGKEFCKRQKQASISQEWKVRRRLWASRTQVPPIQCPPPSTGSCIQLWCAFRKTIPICTADRGRHLGPVKQCGTQLVWLPLHSIGIVSSATAENCGQPLRPKHTTHQHTCPMHRRLRRLDLALIQPKALSKRSREPIPRSSLTYRGQVYWSRASRMHSVQRAETGTRMFDRDKRLQTRLRLKNMNETSRSGNLCW